MRQRIKEWIKVEKEEIENYHKRQWQEPYRSTIAFCKWMESIGIIDDKSCNILDMCCGSGANIYYMSQKYKRSNFLGIDINKELVKFGNKSAREMDALNMKLEYGNIYKMDYKRKNQIDGIILFQTLSWLPEYRIALKNMMKLNPSWIAYSTLLHEGLVECDINVRDYSRKDFGECQEKPYNIYSLLRMEKLFLDNGYDFSYIPFDMDVDIPKNENNKGMGTSTLKLENGKRLQISGPLLLNWYFVVAKKEK